MSKTEIAAMAEEEKDTLQAAVPETSAVTEEKPAPKRRGRKPKAESEGKTETKKKPGRQAKKTAAAEKTGTVTHLQFGGNDVDIAKVEENIKSKFVEEGHRAGNIKSLEIYIKPEENKAWYVINEGKFDGNIDLF